ncbi:MAG: phosphoenolpyruvate hydrolase family protein, partial [Pseudomonadota bacterium]
MLYKDRKFLVGAAVGSGLTALAAERGGADFLLAINAGRMRNMGAPSIAGMLPIQDAREITEAFAVTEVLSQCKAPVFLGVDCFGEEDQSEAIARRAADFGFAGIVNFPSGMHYPPAQRRILDQCGRGIAKEVEVLSHAKARGLMTIFYCATRTHARLGADAGVDMIVLNVGWNAGGSYGHRRRATLEEVALKARDIGRLARRIHPSVKLLLEGGPIVSADDLGQVLGVAAVDGYVGGSTIERLPLESSVANHIAAYQSAARRHQDQQQLDNSLIRWGKSHGFVGRSSPAMAFLNRLKTLKSANMPVVVYYEPGSEISSAISAFSEAHDGVETIRPDREHKFTLASHRLFGGRTEGSGSPGALGDPRCELVFVHAPDKLSPRTQIRLARALASGGYTSSVSRRQRKVHARCIFLMERVPGRNPRDQLTQDLAELVADWEIHYPALRERMDDIPDILDTMVGQLGFDQRSKPDFSPSAIRRQMTNDMPKTRLVVGPV